jgi:hypothetical protein
MVGITLWADEIKAAPPEVRRWLEQEMVRILGLESAASTREATPPLTACHVEEAHRSMTNSICLDKGCATERVIETRNIDEPTREAAIRHLIAVRAYELWENQGRPHGCDLIHWHQAEHEIMSCMEQGSVSNEGAQPAPSGAAQQARDLEQRVRVIVGSGPPSPGQ